MVNERFKGIWVRDFDLKNISSFRIGGLAHAYYIPADLDSFKAFIKWCQKRGKKFLVIGNGSNILFNDRFYPGYIVSLKGFTNYIQLNKNRIICGASIPLNTVIDCSIQSSLKGLEALSGIPGTVGGALIMNAGAFGAQIGDAVEWVKVMTKSGRPRVLNKDRIRFSYRSSRPLERYIILEAGLKLSKGQRQDLLKKQKEVLRKRKEKQPWEYPSCGSIFKRPVNNYAGRLIEKSGLKGSRIGGAEVSRKHANFIINVKKAKARDVLRLIRFIQSTVYKNFKVRLEPEIKFFNF